MLLITAKCGDEMVYAILSCHIAMISLVILLLVSLTSRNAQTETYICLDTHLLSG